MKTIRLRFSIYSTIFILCFLAYLKIVLAAQFSGTGDGIPVDVSLFFSIVSLGFAFYEYRNLTFARLIIENTIISIQAACTEQQSQRHNATVIFSDSIDIHVSCFGILLGSKVIKFNTEGIHLKKVDIGRDFINIRFGKGDKEQFIHLLHRFMGENELMDVIGKFRRETGIIPNIVSDQPCV